MANAASRVPRIMSMHCRATAPGGSFEWHRHDWDELFFINGPTRAGHGGVARRLAGPTLFLVRGGERHGYWNDDGADQPHHWVMHFQADAALARACAPLVAADPERRAWRLDGERRAYYQRMFVRIHREHLRGDDAGRAAESAWLTLLLIELARWADGGRAAPPPEDRAVDDEVLALWQAVIGGDDDLRAATLARRFANYDSLRHRFHKVFGVAPSRLRTDARLERAKHLLLDSALSVKEIARALGYARQHEFARAFRRRFGASPTAWRGDPHAP